MARNWERRREVLAAGARAEWRRLSFTQMYRRQQALALAERNYQGPVDVYARKHRRLLVLWLATRGARVSWERVASQMGRPSKWRGYRGILGKIPR